MSSRKYSAQRVQVGDHGSFRQGDDFHGPVTISGSDALSRLPIAPAAAFNSLEEARAARCHPETRVALLQNILAWVQASTGKNIFWLHGMAGTGKSTISRTLCELCCPRNELGASFFFKRDERDRNNARRFFTTIAAQIASWDPSLRPCLSSVIDGDPLIIAKALREQFQKLIIEPIESIVCESGVPKTMLLVIDALDECDQGDDVKAIIFLLVEATKARKVRFKVFITSRPELPIRLGFSKIRGEYEDLILQDVPKHFIDHDIATFLHSELEKIKIDYNDLVNEDQQLSHDWPGTMVIQDLLQKCVPLFILAATVCRFVGDSSYSDPDDQLNKILRYWSTQGLQTDKLDATYRPVLDQLLTDKSDAERLQLLSEFRQVIGPIVLLEEPLPISSLASLLDVPQRMIDRRLMSLHSVLKVPSSKYMPVRMLHISFRDYLVDLEKKDGNPFWVDGMKTHEAIATQCIRILGTNSTLRKDLCNLQNAGIYRKEISLNDISESIPTEVHYACVYWVHHLERSNAQVSDDHFCFQFLKTHFLHWLETLSLLGKMAESISMIDALRSLVLTTSKTISKNISAFLFDAYRFVLRHRSLIDEMPLQIYTSAITFTPRNSIIRETFADQIPRGLLSLALTDSDWGACLQTLEGHNGTIQCIAFAPNNSTLVSASADGTLRIWNIATGVNQHTIKLSSSVPRILSFSPDGNKLAAVSHGCRIQLWETASWSLQWSSSGGFFPFTIAFTSDSEVLVAKSFPHTDYRYWDASSGNPISRQGLGSINDSNVSVTAWSSPMFAKKGYVHSSELDLLASGSQNGEIRIWSTQELPTHLMGALFMEYPTTDTLFPSEAPIREHKISRISVSPSGQYFASVSWGGILRLWDIEDTTVSHRLSGDSNPIFRQVFSPNSQLLAAWQRHCYQVWNCATGECFYNVLNLSPPNQGTVTFSPDSKLVAFSHIDFNFDIALCDAQGGAELWRSPRSLLLPSIGDSRPVVFSQTGTMLAVAGGKALLLLNISTAELEEGLIGPVDNISTDAFSYDISAIAFSYDQKTVVTGSTHGFIYVWNVSPCKARQTFFTNSRNVKAVTLSPDNKAMVSIGEDNVVRLWDLCTATCQATLHTQVSIRELAFIDDGSRLRTDRGTLTVRANASDPTIDATLDYDVFMDSEWLFYKGRKFLRFPPDYRPRCAAIHGNVFALGIDKSGATVHRLDLDQWQASWGQA